MTLLRTLLHPRSIAIAGDEQPLSTFVLDHLAQSAPRGGVFAVAAGTSAVPSGVTRVRDWASLPRVPDIALLCTPPEATPDTLAAAAQCGVRTVVICTSDPDGSRPDTPFKAALLAVSRKYGCRFLGPGSAGVVLPASGIHASWIPDLPDVGGLAVVSRSGSVLAATAAWARVRGIGFSRLIALGDEADLDAGDILDTLAADTRTRTILLHTDTFANGRTFMLAARGAARIKPVLALCPPQAPQGNDDDAPHDAVLDAAFARAGVLRVHDTEAWFEAAESLARPAPRRDERIAIIANGHGPALLAAAIATRAGLIASVAPATRAQLAAVLPHAVAPGNPLVLGTAPPEDDWLKAIAVLRGDPDVGAIVVVHTPEPALDANYSAIGRLVRALVAVTSATLPDITLCTFGAHPQEADRALLAGAGIALHALPEQAVRAIEWRHRHRRNQAALRQIPASKRPQRAYEEAARAVPAPGTPVHTALATYDDDESPAFLAVCGALWRTLRHGGTSLDAGTADAVLRVAGLTVQSADNASTDPVPLTLSIAHDPVFGRVIVLRTGGYREVLLPPLNSALASDPARTAAQHLLAAAAHKVDAASIEAALVALAGIAVDLPEIVAFTMQAWGTNGALAWQVTRSRIAALTSATPHLALRPYPRELESRHAWRDGRMLLVRPIREDDIPLYAALLARVPPDALFDRFRKRFGDTADAIPVDLLANLARFDYGRDITLIAVDRDAAGRPEALGVVDAFVSAGGEEAEFSILVRPDAGGAGLGARLVRCIIDWCEARGVATLLALTLSGNTRMIRLATRLGFAQSPADGDGPAGLVKLTLALRGSPAETDAGSSR